jgi:hypothetical protein
MRKVRSICLCLILLSALIIAGERPEILHRPSGQYYTNQFDRVTCVVDPGEVQIKAVKIHIKENPKKDLFTEYAMFNDGGVYTFQLIPEMTMADSFVYFITAEFSDFSLLAYPENNPKLHPIAVPITAMERSVETIDIYEVTKIYCDLGRDIEDVKGVTIFTKYDSAQQFDPQPMRYTKERFQYMVKAPSPENSELIYYIIIEYTDRSILMYPSANFDSRPDYRVFYGQRL